MADYEQDITNISERGFDRFLNRENPFGSGSAGAFQKRYVGTNSLGGGVLSSNSIIKLGGEHFKIDGKNKWIIINDGTTNRILIGKF